MRGWRYNGGTLTDADAGPVEIVVSRLRTDASRSRVMDDGRDAPLTVTLYHKRASRHGEETAPRWVAAGKRDCLPNRAERRSRRQLPRARAPRALQAQGAVFPPPVLVRGRRPHALVIARSRAAGDDVAAGLPRAAAVAAARAILGEVRFTLADLLKTNQRRLVREMSMTNVERRVRGASPFASRRSASPARAVRDHPRVGTPRSSSNPRARPLVRDAPRHVQRGGARQGGEATGAETSWTVEDASGAGSTRTKQTPAGDEGGDSRAKTRRARTHDRKRVARGTNGETARVTKERRTRARRNSDAREA